MPADLAIASICKTAFVEPPRAITTVMAFSIDFINNTLGFISFLTSH